MLLSRSPSGPQKYSPIPVGQLEEEIRVRSADECKKFREEFNVSWRGPSALLSRGGGPGRSAVWLGLISQRLRAPASLVTPQNGGPGKPRSSCGAPHRRSFLTWETRWWGEAFVKSPSTHTP